VEAMFRELLKANIDKTIEDGEVLPYYGGITTQSIN
jgi:hypothetical protein